MQMKHVGVGIRKAVVWGVCIGGLAAAMAWSGGCFGRKVPAGSVAPPPGIALPPGAPIWEVASESRPGRVDVLGTAQSEETVHLSAKFAAYVQQVLASAGSAVRQGQPLIRLDDRDIREQMRAAQAQSAQAQEEFNRTRTLMETGAATEQALTAARTAFEAAEARVSQVRVMLADAELTSPMDGVVTDRRVEAGDLAAPGQILLSVYNPKAMRLELAVPMRLIPYLQIGRDVDVTLDYPAGVMTGHVSEIVAEIDPASRTRKVRVRLPASAVNVLPGTFGRAWMDGPVRETLLVPATAVYGVGQLEWVQVAVEDMAVRRLVRTGRADGSGVEVLSGLLPGDRILVHPVTEVGR